MRVLILLCLLFPFAAQADLFKCTDRAGKVTYTNLPCSKMGLTETKVIPPPPAPADQKKGKAPAATKSEITPYTAEASRGAKTKKASSLQGLNRQESSAKKCAKLTDQIGHIMDEMDAARRHGYTAKQESDWDSKLRRLQAEKNRLGCF